MGDNFKLYAKYYDLLYQDKDYNSEVQYIESKLKTHGNDVKSILEFGSGTGKHGVLFNKSGYEVYGLERSERMVEIARKDGLSCEVADITNFQLERKFDAVVSLFHVISYLTLNSMLISTLKNAFNHLKPGGIFIFDAWYSPAVYKQQPLPRIKKMSNDQTEVIRFASPVIETNSNIVDVQFSIFYKDLLNDQYSELFESHPMRHFSIPEIDLLAQHTGFELINTEEFLTEKAPSDATWGVCFILKRK